MSSKSFNYSHNPFNICPKTNEKLATLPSTSPLKEGQVYIKGQVYILTLIVMDEDSNIQDKIDKSCFN